MALGILIEDCFGAELHNNYFHNIERPVFIKNSRKITATGNEATYDDEYGKHHRQLTQNILQKIRYATAPLYGSLRIYYLKGLLSV